MIDIEEENSAKSRTAESPAAEAPRQAGATGAWAGGAGVGVRANEERDDEVSRAPWRAKPTPTRIESASIASQSALTPPVPRTETAVPQFVESADARSACGHHSALAARREIV